MKNYKDFVAEKDSPYNKETLKKYKEEYEKGATIPFGVKASLIAQGMIPHEGGPDKGKKKKTELYEAQEGVIDSAININQVNYGNPPAEYIKIMQRPDDHIKNWFAEKEVIEKIKQGAPANDSETTKEDLLVLLKITAETTAEEIQFARHVDDVNHLAQSFIDLLAEEGHVESMGEFFRVDDQTEGILHFLKDLINRPRPYQLAKYYNYPLFPLIRTDAMSAAYPSGHALTAFVMSEHYAKKYPAVAVKLRALGERIAKSRELTGIHYPSDTAISKEICGLICDNNLLR